MRAPFYLPVISELNQILADVAQSTILIQEKRKAQNMS